MPTNPAADPARQRSEELDRAALLTAKTFYWWSTSQGRTEDHIRDALAAAEESVAIAERANAPREASEALDALGNMQTVAVDLRGHLASQSRRLFWAERIENRNEIVDIHNEVSASHQMIGEYGRAVEHARIALALAEEMENDILRAQSLLRLIVAYFEWDHWTNAINDGDLCQRVAAGTPVTAQNHYRWGMLAFVVALLRTGRADRAEQVLRHLDELSPPPPAQYIAVLRARVQIARGQFGEAEDLLRGALKLTAGRHTYPALLAELAEMGARLGRGDLTEAYGERAVVVGEDSGARKPLAVALRARGLVALAQGRYGDAERDLLDALDRFDRLGTSWEDARTRYVLAECYRRQDRADPRAQEALTEALRLFEQTGAVRDIARARAALAGGEIRLP